MFAPAIGITEDPVTGNAHGPLGGYLIHHKIAGYSGETFEFTGKQGETINRIGKVLVTVQVSNGTPDKVSITGDAVSVFRTVMHV